MSTEKLKVHAADEPEEEEDLVDPMDEIRENACKMHCKNFMEKLQECTDRVNSRKQTLETCQEELMDLFECRDHHAAKEIFKHVK